MEIIRLYKSQRTTAWFMVILELTALVLGGWGIHKTWSVRKSVTE